jgi:small subunit ribosomal protein S6
MRKYEAMIVLDTKGKDETPDQIISAIEKDLIKLGAKIDQIDRLGRRKFPSSPKHVTHGWFVAYQIQAEPTAITKIQSALKFNENIYQQFYVAQA